MADSKLPSDAIAANRRLWGAWTRAHRESAFYDVSGFLKGRDPLNRIETEELGEVSGKRFLHLQCHFGMDTPGWARRGARVTGVDLSAEAIATARRLAGEAGLEATFVEIGHLRHGRAGHRPVRHRPHFVRVSLRWPYLATGGPVRLESEASYAAPIEGGPLPEYTWPHGIGEVVTALIGAGLRIEWLREYPPHAVPVPRVPREA